MEGIDLFVKNKLDELEKNTEAREAVLETALYYTEKMNGVAKAPSVGVAAKRKTMPSEVVNEVEVGHDDLSKELEEQEKQLEDELKKR